MRRRHAGLFAAAGLCVCGCATAQASVASGTFGLPTTASPPILASGILDTSPDGGIYQNPDLVRITLVARLPATALLARLGAGASTWRQLLRFGDFTFVGITLRDGGQAWSDAQLDTTQIASDFAPAGTAAGPLRHFYHPMFALALISQKASDGSCTLHLDPGESASAVLVYPPIRSTLDIVWGVFDSIALESRFGGAAPQPSSGWRVSVCAPPVAPPAA